jgi:hypothetical protein
MRSGKEKGAPLIADTAGRQQRPHRAIPYHVNEDRRDAAMAHISAAVPPGSLFPDPLRLDLLFVNSTARLAGPEEFRLPIPFQARQAPKS